MTNHHRDEMARVKAQTDDAIDRIVQAATKLENLVHQWIRLEVVAPCHVDRGFWSAAADAVERACHEASQVIDLYKEVSTVAPPDLFEGAHLDTQARSDAVLEAATRRKRFMGMSDPDKEEDL